MYMYTIQDHVIFGNGYNHWEEHNFVQNWTKIYKYMYEKNVFNNKIGNIDSCDGETYG